MTNRLRHGKTITVALLLSLLVAGATGCGTQSPQSGPDKAKTPLAQGSYTATVTSHGGDLTVQLDCAEGKLGGVRVVSHTDTPEYIEKVLESLPAAIVTAQSLEVEAVSGATLSANAIKAGVAQCIRDAGGNPREYDYTPTAEATQQQEIVILGLETGDKRYTSEQIQTFGAVEAQTLSVNSAGVKTPLACKGVLLETLLADCGTSQLEYGSVILTASDGYSIELPAALLQKRDVVIAYQVDGEPCSLRAVVPEERAMYWVKFLQSIELRDPVERLQPTQAILLETALLDCAVSDYKYGDSIDQAVAVAELFEKQFTQTADFVELSAIDGWGKNDRYSTVALQYIKTTGEYAPMFIGPDLPEGMRLKETLYLKVGTQMLASAQMAQKKLGDSTLGQYTGVGLGAFITQLGLIDVPTYTITSVNGDTVSIPREELDKGVVYTDEAGAHLRFDGSSGSMTVQGLLSITGEGN